MTTTRQSLRSAVECMRHILDGAALKCSAAVDARASEGVLLRRVHLWARGRRARIRFSKTYHKIVEFDNKATKMLVLPSCRVAAGRKLANLFDVRRIHANEIRESLSQRLLSLDIRPVIESVEIFSSRSWSISTFPIIFRGRCHLFDRFGRREIFRKNERRRFGTSCVPAVPIFAVVVVCTNSRQSISRNFVYFFCDLRSLLSVRVGKMFHVLPSECAHVVGISRHLAREREREMCSTFLT